MPVKSRSHESDLTLAGHPASPSGTEPFEWSVCPAGSLLAVRQSGTESQVTTGGAGEDSNTDTIGSGTKEGTLRFTHITIGNCSTSHTPDRYLLTQAAGGSERSVYVC